MIGSKTRIAVLAGLVGLTGLAGFAGFARLVGCLGGRIGGISGVTREGKKLDEHFPYYSRKENVFYKIKCIMRSK